MTPLDRHRQERLESRMSVLADQNGATRLAGHLFHSENKIHLGPHQAFLAERCFAAEEDLAKVQHNPKPRTIAFLEFAEGFNGLSNACYNVLAYGPVREKTVPQKLVDRSVLVLNDLFAGREPTSGKARRLLRRQLLEELRGILKVRHQQPAVSGPDVLNGFLGRSITVVSVAVTLMPESEAVVSDLYQVAFIQTAGLRDAAPVDVGSIA